MKLYLAGPMRGYPDFNFPAFHLGAQKLRAAGYEVFSPAERDLNRDGDVFTGTDGNLEKLEAATGFSLRQALKDDVDFICEHADGVALLPGWEASEGAKAEAQLGRALRLKVGPVETFLGE